MRNIAKFKRGINHYYTIIEKLIHERVHKAHNTRIKYIFFKRKNSDTLIVSFPACAKNTAKYNYMGSLIPFRCNKLFLLDDFGDNHQGCYLIEENVELCTIELIKKIIDICRSNIQNSNKLKNVVFIGSSKGGYSALNFALHFPNVKVVIGGPQYNLGSYLHKPDTLENLKFLIGEITEEKKYVLNKRLCKKIQSAGSMIPDAVYFHYSNIEHTYKEHIEDLLNDMRKANIRIIEDIHHYSNHDELSEYFSRFLDETLRKIIASH